METNDSKRVASRALRDRWLEKVNAGEHQFESAVKYEVSRMIVTAPDTQNECLSPAKLLAA